MSELKMPKIALGTWAWGSDGTFGEIYTADDLRPVFEAGMKCGLNFWDTSYAYGLGTSEKILASFLKGLPRDSYIVSNKFTPHLANEESDDPMREMIEMQLGYMEMEKFDIYWIHHATDAPKWTKALAEYYDGREDAPLIGISNHDLPDIIEAEEILKSHGLKLSAIQNHYSLIERVPDTTGVLEYCRKNDIPFFSYMVLEQGALSGKYDTKHPMPEGTMRGDTYNPWLGKLEVLNDKIKEIAAKHGVGPAQIPIAWAIAKGTIPLIGVTKVSQVEDAARAAAVELTEEEIREMEELALSLELRATRFWEEWR